MGKVYIITRGNFGDFSFKIKGCCSTLEKAKELKKILNSTNPIEEIELDKNIDWDCFGVNRKMMVGLKISKYYRYIWDWRSYDFEDEFNDGEIEFGTKESLEGECKEFADIKIKAKGVTEAKKIANDALNKIIAFDLWGKVKNIKDIK